jgi:Tol biopolymer transport system component
LTAGKSEIPYPTSLLEFTDHRVDTPCVVVERLYSNYETRTMFAAYLAYNFRGDPATLADDLLRQWVRGDRALIGLQNLLGDQDSCVTCASKSYFRPGGVPLSKHDRLALLHHNWRVANYVNNSNLPGSEGQYGYPTQFGWSPAGQLKCWQDFDDCGAINDVVVIPPEVVLNRTHVARDTTFVGERSFRGNTFPMYLQPYGSEYWVIRSDPSLWDVGRDLVVRVSPESLNRIVERVLTPGSCNVFQCINCIFTNKMLRDTRLVASVIGYAPPSGSVATGRLWEHPEWAQLAAEPRWVDVDSLAGPLEFVIPNFGTTYKAAVVVISLADGPAESYSSGGSLEYTPVLPYRLSLAIRSQPFQTLNPSSQAGSSAVEDHASWAPSGSALVYQSKLGSALSQIERKTIGGSPSPLSPSSNAQSHPDWSPRGDWVAFSEDEGPLLEDNLWLFNIETSERRRMTQVSGAENWASFDNDGQRLAYVRVVSLESGPCELHRVKLDGSGDVVLVVRSTPGIPMGSPRWSPDGATLFFTVNDTLYTVPADGGQVQVESVIPPRVATFDLTRGVGRGGRSPILVEEPGHEPFTSSCPFASCGCVPPSPLMPFRRIALRDTLTADAETRFYRTGVEFFNPRWSPDGTRIAYSATENGPANRDVFVGQVSYDHAPVFASLNDTIMEEGHDLIIDLHASDSDGDAITFVAPPRYLPAGASFSGNRFQWDDVAPAGSAHFVVFRALDPNGGVHSKVVKITVIENQGGSGCPFVDTQTAQGWQVENSILGRSATGAFELDPYRLEHAPEIVDGKVHLRIRENEQELTTLDRVQLLAIDHPTGSQVFRLGERTVIAALSRAHRVTDGQGTDLTSRFLAGAYQGHPGDTLYVDMTDASSLRAQVGTEGVGPQATTNDEGEGGYMNGFQKPIDPEGMRHQLANEGAAAAADVQVLNETGILVEAPDGRGGWRLVKHYYPREHAAECTLDSLGRGPLRLIFVGRHALSYIGRMTDITAAPEPQSLSLTAARHSRLGSVAAALGAGGTTTSLSPGDTLDLEFAAGAVPEDKVRTYFLLSTGVYTDASSARAPQVAQEQALPTRFALAQNKPNPFATTTTIDFALPSSAQVRLEVFDLQGRLVRVLADRRYEPGYHAAEWDRRDQSGSSVGAGIYLYRLRAGAFVEQRKMVLLAR